MYGSGSQRILCDIPEWHKRRPGRRLETGIPPADREIVASRRQSMRDLTALSHKTRIEAALGWESLLYFHGEVYPVSALK